MLRLFLFFIFYLSLLVSCFGDSLRLAVTTSFDNSGLADYLLPFLESDTGIEIDLVVVGTGRALRLGEAGDVDAILVHSPSSERLFIDLGYATHRREIMYNDFVIVGPLSDPSGIFGSVDSLEALSRISASGHPFVSRGDDSGTHKKELSLWSESGISPDSQFDDWYIEVGSGMGRALNVASGLSGYILTDRGSWLNFGNRGDLVLLYEGDVRLRNIYSFLAINPARHVHIDSDLVDRLESWLVSSRGQGLIGSYRIGGEVVFTPSAR